MRKTKEKLRYPSAREIWLVISPWWRSSEKRIAWASLFVLLGLTLAGTYFSVLLNEWSRDFYQAFEHRSIEEFFTQIKVFVILIPLILFNFCASSFLRNWLAFRWRYWATKRLQGKWLAGKNYYLLPLKGKALDNPDQRISQDIAEICYKSLRLSLDFFNSLITFFTFAVILWGLSHNLSITLFGKSVVIPGSLLWMALLYALFGTLLALRLGRPLLALDIAQEKLEADFRYRLIRIREHREEVAKLQGEKFEERQLEYAFSDIAKNYYLILRQQVYFNLFENFYVNIQSFIPLIIVGPHYFSGALTLGVLMQVRGIFMRVENALSLLATSFTEITGLLASLRRLSTFEALLNEKERKNAGHSLVRSPQEKLEVKDVVLFSPQSNLIWKVPSFSLVRGERKRLKGPSGRGKSTLFRVLGGLYPYFEGEVVLPSSASTMIVPQRPYMPLGTLRECLTYPGGEFKDEEVIQALHACSLGHLESRLDKVSDYQNHLSLGEQQRLNFVRILLHKPSFLLMDEPLAHLDTELAARLLQVLITALPTAGILLISHQEEGRNLFEEIG